jgi:hypothetical protein
MHGLKRPEKETEETGETKIYTSTDTAAVPQ